MSDKPLNGRILCIMCQEPSMDIIAQNEKVTVIKCVLCGMQQIIGSSEDDANV